MRMLQARNELEECVLDVAWQTRRNAVDVDLGGLTSFRLEKQLVRIFFGKPHHFVFDRWTIPRPARADLPAVHGSAMEIRANHIVHRLICMRDPTRELIDLQPFGEKRERLRIVVAGLEFHLRVVDRPTVESRGRSGLEALDTNPFSNECRGDAGRSSLTGSSAGRLCFPGVHHRLQECAGGQDHGIGLIGRSAPHAYSADPGAGVLRITRRTGDHILNGLLP